MEHKSSTTEGSSSVPYPRAKEARTYLSPTELATIVKYLTAADHHYFPKSDEIQIPFKNHLKNPDPTVALFRWTYPELCWHPEILEKAGFDCGRQILELGSGNNNLVTSPALSGYLQKLSSDTYVLSNYSGGRGDFFSLKYLAHAISERMRHSTSSTQKLTHLHLCHTCGAQGGITGVADYLAKYHEGKAVALADSTYCGMYAPLASSGIPLNFISTADQSKLPRIEDIISTLKKADVIAYFLIPFHNASGEWYSEHDLGILCTEVQKLGKYLIVSEVYDGMNWNSDSDITAQIDKHTVGSGLKNFVRLFSLSKSRGLAGLRAGYVLSTEHICAHIAQVNALHSFNPPMINAKLILLHELLGLYSRTSIVPSDSLEYLGLTIEQFYTLFTQHLAERKTLNTQCYKNFSIVAERLIGREFTKEELAHGPTLISSDLYDIIIPRGGMNCTVRIKYLEQFDQVDLFRKVYLWSGLIMHTSRYLNKEAGTWVRITLTHAPEIIRQGIDSLNHLESAYKHLHIKSQHSISHKVI